jgi:hypothetical protein
MPESKYIPPPKDQLVDVQRNNPVSFETRKKTINILSKQNTQLFHVKAEVHLR